MPISVVPRYFLYGEPPQAADDRFLHVEDLDDRSRPAAWTIRPHAHADLHHVFHIRRGRGTLTAEDEDTAFAAPCVLVVPAGVVHGFVYDGVSEGRVLTVSDAVLRGLGAREDAPAASFEAALCLTLPTDSRVEAVLDDLRRELSRPAPGRHAALMAHLTLLLVELGRLRREGAARAPLKPAAHAQIVARFRAAIEESYCGAIGLDAYCRRLGTTPGRLRMACRAVAGATPGRMIADRIVLQAKRALRYSGLPVSEIAYGLGFRDPAYFSRYFVRETGLTPTAFRRDA